MTRKWSAEIVISVIKHCRKYGEPLNSNHVQKEQNSLYQAACRYYGSWKSAIECAGISYSDVRVKKPNRKVVWTKEKILSTIKLLHVSGEALNSNHVQQFQIRLYGAAVKYFGSWGEAVKSAGLSYDKIRAVPPPHWTKELVVSCIQERHALDLSIGMADVSKEDSGLVHAARRLFGSQGWRKARVAAGFSEVDVPSFQIWTRESVCQEIRRLNNQGVSLSCANLIGTENRFVYGSGKRIFGSWANAVLSAGLNYEEIRSVRQWTRRRVLREIKALEKARVRLSLKDIQQRDSGLLGAAIARFGSWSSAVEAAGISYRRHSKVWSTKAWLRRMTSAEYTDVLSRSVKHAKTRKGIKK